MPREAIEAVGERLATLCIEFALPANIPEHIRAAHSVPQWLTFSVATVYLSFAKHWLAFLPVKDVWMATGRHMDDCFFDFVKQTSFDVAISKVIVDPRERAAICVRGPIPVAEFDRTISPIDFVLELVFADRCNQYNVDLREGIIFAMENKESFSGPLVFVYKRFSQHVYGEEELQFLVEFDLMFMDALTAITECVRKSGDELPFSL